MRSHASTSRPLYSAELARLAGVSTDTLRYYERRGLLPAAPRSPCGYRLFPPETLVRVQLIPVHYPFVFAGDAGPVVHRKTNGHKPARLLEAFAATHPKCCARSSPLALMPRGNPKQGKQS